MNNRDTFRAHLEAAYTDLFATDPEYAYVASRTTPAALAERMTASLEKGTANKDGEGIRRACRAVGIRHTYRAITAYLRA